MSTTRAGIQRLLLLLVAVALGLRLLTLGAYPLADQTEARYAEIARKMVEIGDWVTPWYDYGIPFWAKPPLSIWMTSLGIGAFGTNEFAARLPHFLGAILLLAVMVDWLRRRNRDETVIALVLLAGAALFYVAAGAVMTDMALALCALLAMRGFWLGLYGDERDRRRERWLFFVALGLGLLAKGPIMLVLAGLPIAAWTLWRGGIVVVWRGLPWLRGALLMLAIALPWYALAEQRTPGFLAYFIIGEHWHRFVTPGWRGDLYGSAHAFPLGSIWLFAVIAFLPWSLLLPAFALRRRMALRTLAPMNAQERDFQIYLLLWALAPCVFFSVAGNILWTYVLPALPALAMLIAQWLARWPAPARPARLLVAGALFMPLLLVGGICWLHLGGTAHMKSEKIVADYFLANHAPGERLIYFGSRPYSASFYTAGAAVEAVDAGALRAQLAHGAAYVVIDESLLDTLPVDLHAALHPLRRHRHDWYCHANAMPAH